MRKMDMQNIRKMQEGKKILFVSFLLHKKQKGGARMKLSVKQTAKRNTLRTSKKENTL